MFQDILLGLMKYVPDHFKRKEMYNGVVRKNPWVLKHVPDHFKTQEMCDKAVEIDSFILWHVPDHLKTQDICDKAVKKVPWSLEFVPNCFVTQGQIKLWRDDDDYCNDDRFIEWYEDYKKRRAQKAPIKEELLPIAWRPLRWWDWCMSEAGKMEIFSVHKNLTLA